MKKLLLIVSLLTISFVFFAKFKWNRYDHEYVATDYTGFHHNTYVMPCHRPGKQFRFYYFQIVGYRWCAEDLVKALEKQGVEIYRRFTDPDYYEEYANRVYWRMSFGDGCTDQNHFKNAIENSSTFICWNF